MVTTLCSNTFADDEDVFANQWLINFTHSGLVSANALISSNDPNNWNKKEFESINFDFSTLEYQYIYDLKYEESWDVLTRNGVQKLPRIEKKYISSRVNHWTNFKGVGVYTESYERFVPNWQNFNQFIELLVSIAKYEFDSPINGLFMKDEVKILKRLYKNKDLKTSCFWKQLDYDKKGNVLGVSSTYLKSNFNQVGEQQISVLNNKGERLYFSPILFEHEVILSGVRISSANNELFVFNTALNRVLYKFASQIFPDPEKVFLDYLTALQKDSDKNFERLAYNFIENE